MILGAASDRVDKGMGHARAVCPLPVPSSLADGDQHPSAQVQRMAMSARMTSRSRFAIQARWWLALIRTENDLIQFAERLSHARTDNIGVWRGLSDAKSASDRVGYLMRREHYSPRKPGPTSGGPRDRPRSSVWRSRHRWGYQRTCTVRGHMIA